MTYSKAYLLRDITSYSDAELEKLVDDIRERRSRVAVQIGKLKTISAHHARERTEAALVKKAEKFINKLNKVDAAIVELENRLTEVLALRLQLGDDITDDATGTANRNNSNT